MFARYYVELPTPVEDVERVLLDAPQAWLPGLMELADARRDRLLTDVGFGERIRVGTDAVVEFGQPIRLPSKMILPIRWHAAGHEQRFPTLEADIEVAPLTPSTTQLSMSARYTPPMGALGRAVDRALLHRVAEATVKDFVDRVASTIVGRSLVAEA
jgi:hypothetical protein